MSHLSIGYFRHRFASLPSYFLLSEPYAKLPQNLNNFYYYHKKKFAVPSIVRAPFFEKWKLRPLKLEKKQNYLSRRISTGRGPISSSTSKKSFLLWTRITLSLLSLLKETKKVHYTYSYYLHKYVVSHLEF